MIGVSKTLNDFPLYKVAALYWKQNCYFSKKRSKKTMKKENVLKTLQGSNFKIGFQKSFFENSV